ncbi:MAG TPA: outer membrane lipoprotein-sorting protein [Candidatus Marinimicrobia bacterium]|nr:outer membrane lipoprotein-sorting protein [Candidatus Neomarinimicrobiota bacterium]
MKWSLIFCLISCTALLAQTPDALAILKKVDENMSSENRIFVSKMVIESRRGSREIRAKSYVRGTDQAFTEYLSPSREKGVKMLKLGDELWNYSPKSDRTIRIAGHMLRQSLMGSDLSYDDMMENPILHHIYDAFYLGEEEIIRQRCTILELKAKKADVNYQKRKIWVDTEHNLVLKEERYAASGKLLKSTEVLEIMQTEDRWIPKITHFKDELQNQNKGTTFIIEELQFNADIPDYIFTKAALK